MCPAHLEDYFFQGKELCLGHSSFISVWTRHMACCDKCFFLWCDLTCEESMLWAGQRVTVSETRRSWESLESSTMDATCLQPADIIQRKGLRNFPGGPVVKTSLYNAGDVGLIPGWGNKSPWPCGQKIKKRSNIITNSMKTLNVVYIKKKKS